MTKLQDACLNEATPRTVWRVLSGENNGRTRQILTQERVEEDGREKEDARMKERRAHGEEIGRSEVGTGAVFAGEVEEVLVGGGGGDEGGSVGKVFEVEEFGFDGCAAGFDVGVGVGASGRVEAMECPRGGDGAVKAVRAVVDGVTVELGAQVGADFVLGQRDAMVAQVVEHACDGEGGIGFGEGGGVGQKEGASGLVADGVLEAGQAA
jgi:hypothetical protein